MHAFKVVTFEEEWSVHVFCVLEGECTCVCVGGRERERES